MKKLLKMPLRLGGRRYPAGAVVDLSAADIAQLSKIDVLSDVSAVDLRSLEAEVEKMQAEITAHDQTTEVTQDTAEIAQDADQTPSMPSSAKPKKSAKGKT